MQEWPGWLSPDCKTNGKSRVEKCLAEVQEWRWLPVPPNRHKVPWWLSLPWSVACEQSKPMNRVVKEKWCHVPEWTTFELCTFCIWSSVYTAKTSVYTINISLSCGEYHHHCRTTCPSVTSNMDGAFAPHSKTVHFPQVHPILHIQVQN